MRSSTLPIAARLTPPLAILIALVLVAPLLIYWDTLLSMVAIWNRSDTFTHQYLIAPISLWLIWRQRKDLQGMMPKPFLPALLLLVACSFGWLLGELAGVQVVKQFALVMILISTTVALLGLQISRAIVFPLAFLLLAVPFGEVFIEPLIQFTANFTIAALQLTGIPVWREGNTFVIPSGHWSVVEACSGVRYLIASITLGVLYAHLTYRSPVRKLSFILVSVVVPVLANGLRAYMIVMIGHLSSMQLAVGVDHLIYGWLFFGIVMFLMFWIGGFWVDAQKNEVAEDISTQKKTNTQAVVAQGSGALSLCAALTLAAICFGPAYAFYMQRANASHSDISLTEVQSSWANGDAFTPWGPDFNPGVADLNRFYQADGQHIGLLLRYYRNQRAGSMLVSSGNRILTEKHSPWIRIGGDTRAEQIAGRTLKLREERIQGASGSILIWRWYWIDQRFEENDYIAKLLQTKSQLEMHGDDGAALFVFTPLGEKPEQARQTLRSYLNDNLAFIEATLKNAKR